MASTYLTKTFASDSNRKTWTWSGWIKRAGTGTQTLMTQVDAWSGNSNAGFYIVDNYLTAYNFTTSLNAGSGSYNRPSKLLRDFHGWYHIVVRLDTTQATASDRLRWYVNGEQLTDFQYANYPSQNQDCNFNGGDPHGIGGHTTGANYFSGIMSHVHFCDGQSYAPTEFGEFDANGVWKIKTSPSVTYGTHGFFILKDSGSVTDQSGNGNNFTVSGGTLTNTLDCPDNVFATLNPLYLMTAQPTFSYGNLRITNSLANKAETSYSTIAPSSGKWYAEFKCTSGTVFRPGISSTNASQAQGDPANNQNYPGQWSEGWGWYYANGVVYNNGTTTGITLSTFTQGDIVAVALDLDNMKLYFSKNGSWQNSADPSAGTGGIDISSISSGSNVVIGMQVEDSSAGLASADANFGNGYFGTTAVSSAGTNASGIGIFEYDVPTGYTALSTKGLNL